MKKKLWIVVLTASLFLAGCSVKVEQGGQKGEKGVRVATAAERSAEGGKAGYRAPDGATQLGEAITVDGPVRLATVRQRPADFFEKTILVEATAADVCQARGCWLTIRDGEGDPIWVRWSSGCGGKYAFPKDVSGKRVVVQGSIYEKEIDDAAAEHIAAESDGLEAEKIAGKTLEMNATAFVILPEEKAPEKGADS